MIKKIPVEVCFSPAMYHRFHNTEANVVIVDILRATTAICTAFLHGARSIIPVQTLEEARQYKQNGYLVAAERDGIKSDFADFGNSPFNFISENVSGKTIVYSTTNGTQAIHMAKGANQILIGSFLNIDSLVIHLIESNHPVVIFCAGWKDRFSLEDTIFAGALVEKLTENEKFYAVCDSAIASLDLWQLAKPDLLSYIEKAAQRSRLRKNKLDDILEYTFTFNQTHLVPYFNNQQIVVDNHCEKNHKISPSIVQNAN